MEPQIKISEVQRKIGEIVEAYRKKERLTQKELAIRIGASRPTISNIENGRGVNTTIILKIFKYFNGLHELNAFFESMLIQIEEETGLTDLDFYE